MPLKPRDIEAVGPDEPHFALLMDGTGARLAIRPGASLWLVEDKSQADKIFPLTLKKVSHKKLVFEFGGTEYEYRLTTAKPKTKEALQRMADNRKDLATKVQR